DLRGGNPAGFAVAEADRRAAGHAGRGGGGRTPLADRAAAAGARVRAARGAAGAQLAAAGALWLDAARLPCLPGRRVPDDIGDPVVGRGPHSGGAGPVVAAVADARPGHLAVRTRRTRGQTLV